MQFLTLPNDVIMTILGFLTWEDLCPTAVTNKRLARLLQENAFFWEQKVSRDYTHRELIPKHHLKTTWKTYYTCLYWAEKEREIRRIPLSVNGRTSGINICVSKNGQIDPLIHTIMRLAGIPKKGETSHFTTAYGRYVYFEFPTGRKMVLHPNKPLRLGGLNFNEEYSFHGIMNQINERWKWFLGIDITDKEDPDTRLDRGYEPKEKVKHRQDDLNYIDSGKPLEPFEPRLSQSYEIDHLISDARGRVVTATGYGFYSQYPVLIPLKPELLDDGLSKTFGAECMETIKTFGVESRLSGGI